MRILHLNTNDSTGGAAKLALSLHRQLRAAGEESDFYVRRRSTSDPTVTEIGNAGDRLAERLVQAHMIDGNRTDMTNCPFTFTFGSAGGFFTDDAAPPWDVVHLHWIERFLSPGNLARLVASGRPLVWTAHDAKPATGGCHCTYDCTGYKTSCHPCPQLAEDSLHLPERVLKTKQRVFAEADVTPVAPSNWMAGVLSDSAVFSGKEIRVIPHGIDTSVFSANGRAEAKENAGISMDTTTLLFSARNPDAHHKGFSQLLETLERCRTDERFRARCSNGEISMLVVGKRSPDLERLPIPFKAFGRIETAEEVASIYRAADILINPSLVESFSLVSLEAMACGVAVAGFRTGGMTDFLDEDCGVLVPYQDTAALSSGVLDLVFDVHRRASLAHRAAAKVREGYRLEIMASRYRDLYGELLGRPPHPRDANVPKLDRFDDVVAHCAVREVRELRQASRRKQERIADLREHLRSKTRRVARLQRSLESRKQRVSSLQKRLEVQTRQYRRTVHCGPLAKGRSALGVRPLRIARGLARRLRRQWIPAVTPGRISDSDLLSIVSSERPVIFDVGCNDGTHTAWFLDLFPNATVHCFEPDPRPRKRFATKVQDPRAHLHPVALAGEDGTASFYQSGGIPPDEPGPRPKNWHLDHPEGWDYSGSIRKPKKHLDVHPWVTFPTQIEVQTRRLDSWLCEQDDIDVIDLIWADVQGAEVDLISGGREAFRRTRYVFMEYSNSELYEGQIDLRRILRTLRNYEVVIRYADDVLLRNRKPISARSGPDGDQ